MPSIEVGPTALSLAHDLDLDLQVLVLYPSVTSHFCSLAKPELFIFIKPANYKITKYMYYCTNIYELQH